ncbi:HAMP domain-containing sensor histidine kinase [Hymenobacter sp. YC55]|uniref:sensor histidine kinase n=1 Tax=Hymenobacter sp. YC55 TaxID=3034019 RepID=UPI0023F7C32F|nr:HAMP domain-containing sensor histidine kinase [Hymenobacter sp. YC55]MDF7813754.1 HAMP domain-containing sensor histidine kinase [Hymenobacter sp. YC55]
MPDLPPSAYQALEAELRAAQAEVARLQAERDQHAAHHAERERYRLSQVRFRTVFEHSPLGHKIIAADLTIRQANAAVAALLGLASPLDLLGHTILEFAHPDYVADWARLQVALWAHHLPWFALETCLVRPDGSLVWCRVTSVLFPDESGELGYTTLEDISARRHLEAQVQHTTQALEDANQDLGASNEELRVLNDELQHTNSALGQLNTELDTFVYAAAHDLRLPVANLQGLVQALVEQLPPAARQAEQVELILTMMQESMARFRHTLDRLADFGATRVQADLPRESVQLAAVLEEVRQELAVQFAATGGQLEVELAGPARLWFAAKHVHSVLLNLISNALKYRHPDRVPIVRVRSYREAGRLVVRVHDNGLGLSAAQQQQLFGLFRRLHAHVEGTGVGLYLVKKILDQAGGSIEVESELGRGSTFTATFPT